MVNTKIRLIIFFAAKDGEALYSQQKQKWELTVDQSMNSLYKIQTYFEKVQKTTRAFRYDLHQIHYDYTVEVRNRFKGLDLMDRVPEELWMEVVTLYRRKRSRPFPRKRNAKNWSKEALQIAVKRREVKSKGEKERYKHLMQSSKE